MGQIVDISQAMLELGVEDATANERAILARGIVGAEGAIIRHLGYDPAQRSRSEFYPNREQVLGYGNRGVWDLDEGKTQAVLTSRAAFSDLQVRHIPIRSVTSLWVNIDARATNARFTADHLKTQASGSTGGDFWLNNELLVGGSEVCPDGVLKSFGLWPLEPGSVKITYTAGYAEAELQGTSTELNARPIVDAILNETVRRSKKVFLNRKQTGAGWTPGPITSERLGDYGYVVSGGAGTAAAANFSGTNDILPETVQMLADFVNWGWRLFS